MEALRLEVRRRSLLLDRREYVFITEDGREVQRTDTDGVVRHVERHVNRHLRGAARAHGRAQILQALRQFNSPKEGYTQFVVVEAERVEELGRLEGRRKEVALDAAVVAALQARIPVDLLAIEKWAKDHAFWIGLSGKNQALGGKVRLAREGIESDFEPEKLLARSLLDKPEAFRGPTIRLLVMDDPFLDAVSGDGAFLLRASAPRTCTREVTQRVRRCLDYEVRDAQRGQTYLRLEFEDKVARHDTEILSVREDGDLLWLLKRETARIDTGAKLVHELGFKGTAIVVDRLPEHIEQEWPRLDGVCNSSCIKSNALLSAHSQEALWGNFQKAFLLHLPVRMLFTGEERFSTRGNRVSLNVLSTLHTVSSEVLDRMVEARTDDCPGPVIHALLWWADHMEALPESVENLPSLSKGEIQTAWGDDFERRFAFGDLADHPVFDTETNPDGFVARGRGGNRVLVPSARALLATLGQVEVEGEPGFHFPDYLNTLLQTLRCLDVKPERFEKVLKHLQENVLRAANAMLDAHSIRVRGLHGVLVAADGLGERVIVPDGRQGFRGTIHGEPTMNRDGIRSAKVEPLSEARSHGSKDPAAAYLLEHLVPEDFYVVLADFDRLTKMNRDSDGDLIYVSRLEAPAEQYQALEDTLSQAEGFVEVAERKADLTSGFHKLKADHDPRFLPPEVVHKAVIDTAGSARDVGSITLWKYVVQEALAEKKRWDLFAPVARVAQAYIDGMKGPHQTSANLFAALMRVWSRMAAPCISEKEGEQIVAVKLSKVLVRELTRAGYRDGHDFFARVEVPHPALAEEAYRKIKRPLVTILEVILADIEKQGMVTRSQFAQLRDVLESEYGVYPVEALEDRDSIVAERKATYGAVQRLYGIVPVQSLAEVEGIGRRPLWKRLADLSLAHEDAGAVLSRRAAEAQAYGRRPEDIVI